MRVLRDAFRQLRQSPGFTTAAVLSLALGISATTAMLTLLDALLLRPLSVREPDRLVRISGLDAQGQDTPLSASLLDLLRRERLFDGVCGFGTPLETVEMQGRVAATPTHAMTVDCFESLGVTPARGRMLEPTDDRPGAPSVAVLTYDIWQRDFGGRADVLGQEITISGNPATIVGVTQPGFRGVQFGFPTHLVYPLASLGVADRTGGVFPSLDVVARLKRGDSIDGVTARLQTMWPRLLKATVPPEYEGAQRERYVRQLLSVPPASTGIDYSLRDRFQRPLVALLAIAALVLLISCVNVANLLLARGLARRRDMSVRLALGAGRWRLIRDALTESLLLLVVAASVGVMVAYWGTELLVSLFALAQPNFSLDVTPDPRTLSLTCATAVVAFVVFAVIPAWRSSRADVTAVLSGSSSRVVGDRAPFGRVLVVAQVALALTLVTGAVLFATALAHLRAIPLGFTPPGVLGVQLMPLPGAYQNRFAGGVYYRDLIERMTSLPSVRAVALAKVAPLFTRPYFVSVGTPRNADVAVQAEWPVVTDGFLRTMGIPLVAGRDFRPSDASNGPRTAIVSESLARKLFGDRDPLGQRVQVDQAPNDRSLEVVGVARDAILTSPQRRNRLVLYHSFWQEPEDQRYPVLLIRTTGDPIQIAGAVRQELREGGREYDLRMRTLPEERDASLAQERLLAALSIAFGWVGLTLAAIGLYGLLNFSVTRRTGEIGIRMALGAERAHILRLVLREALVLIAAGVLIGLPITLAGASAVRTLLYGVGPFDVAPLGVSVGVLVVVGILATWIPAGRAASIAPSEALRHD